jgi:poly-beta-hydroxyalkanoate depolymerase
MGAFESGLFFRCGEIVIHVRNNPSQVWDVITEPSTVAFRPTMMLVHPPASSPGVSLAAVLTVNSEFVQKTRKMTMVHRKHWLIARKRLLMLLLLKGDILFKSNAANFFSEIV